MLQRIGPIKAAWIVTTCVMMCAKGRPPMRDNGRIRRVGVAVNRSAFTHAPALAKTPTAPA